MSAEPPSDHFDGERFRNPGSTWPPSVLSVLRWKLTSKPARWPQWIEDARTPVPPPVREGELAVTFVGHATVLIHHNGHIQTSLLQRA